jgi:hypothetical protein
MYLQSYEKAYPSMISPFFVMKYDSESKSGIVGAEWLS